MGVETAEETRWHKKLGMRIPAIRQEAVIHMVPAAASP